MQCNGNINQNFIIDGGNSGPSISACTSVFTNQINSCSGNTSIILGTDTVDFTGAVSASTYYGDGSNLSGIFTQDTYVTGFTYLNNGLTIRQPLQPDLVVNIDVMTGLTVDGVLSATTYYGDGSFLTGISGSSGQDTYITGSTFSSNTLTLTNNTGGTISANISSFDSISATTYENLPLDIYITGSTYLDNTLTLTNNTGGTINTHIDTFTALTINTIEVTTISATTYMNLPSDVAFSGTYLELKAMIDNNELLVGKKYVLTDYQTVYQINGSNSSNKIQEHTIIGKVGSYSQFNNVPEDIVVVGSTVICTYAPIGATVVTGQTFTIVEYFSSGFIRFSPTIVNPLDFGVILKFQKQRYPNIPSDITINDVNGKPVIKPSGVLNTEVHDDGPYMSMTGAENPSPIIEKLVLTAIDTNQFSVYSESLTYIGDTLTYDFNDNIVYDENGYIIGNRNGNILKRTNVTGVISVNKDWRVQRYRRYRVDDINLDSFFLTNSLNPITSGTTIYNIAGVNHCTIPPNISNDHKFFLNEPSYPSVYTNFATNVINPFLSGVTTAPTVSRTPNNRFHWTPYGHDITLPLSGLTGTTLAKDFTIIPLINYEPSNLVDYFSVDSLSNSVFLTYSQHFGTSVNINVNSKNGTINNSSFMTGSFGFTNSGIINNTRTFDSGVIGNTSTIDNVNIFNYGSINNKGFIGNSTFGGGGGSPSNDYIMSETTNINACIFGGNLSESFIINGILSNSLIVTRTLNSSNLNGTLYLTLFKAIGNIYGSDIKLLTSINQIPSKGYYGYIYDFSNNLSDIDAHNNNFKKNLISNTIDINNITTITTISTVQ